MNEYDLDAFIESRRWINKHETFSQAYQDLFVRYMTNFKSSGFYLEIGSGEPKQSNNSYILESKLGWNGFSVDINSGLVETYNLERKNPSIKADATKFDFERELKKRNFPKQIDYLSLDIDPAEVTYKALISLPHKSYRFSVITYEHDYYLSGRKSMDDSRVYLESLGYLRVISNVKCKGRDFEDWYVDPIIIQPEIFKPFLSHNIECDEIFKKIQ